MRRRNFKWLAHTCPARRLNPAPDDVCLRRAEVRFHEQTRCAKTAIPDARRGRTQPTCCAKALPHFDRHAPLPARSNQDKSLRENRAPRTEMCLRRCRYYVGRSRSLALDRTASNQLQACLSAAFSIGGDRHAGCACKRAPLDGSQQSIAAAIWRRVPEAPCRCCAGCACRGLRGRC